MAVVVVMAMEHLVLVPVRVLVLVMEVGFC